jgi:hypothetical protein
MPTRRDELGTVAESLQAMNALLLDKDASLRATLAGRERALEELTKANADLALRDARARAYAEFVSELKTLDVGALAAGGLQTLVRLPTPRWAPSTCSTMRPPGRGASRCGRRARDRPPRLRIRRLAQERHGEARGGVSQVRIAR